jgi:hypothetical protein
VRFRETQSSRSARLEGWGGPWFETPRTRLRNLGGPKIAAPHHEAGRNRECIKLTGNRFRVSYDRSSTTINLSTGECKRAAMRR